MTKTSRAMEISKEIVVRHRCFDVDDGSYGMSIRALEHRIAQALEDYAEEEVMIALKYPAAELDRLKQSEDKNLLKRFEDILGGLGERISTDVEKARAEEREACAALIQSLRGYRHTDPSQDVFDYVAQVIRERGRGDKAEKI